MSSGCVLRGPPYWPHTCLALFPLGFPPKTTGTAEGVASKSEGIACSWHEGLSNEVSRAVDRTFGGSSNEVRILIAERNL